MKILVLFAGLVAFASPAPAINEALQNDIADFLEVLPIEKIRKIAIEHLHNDQEFQAAVQYMKGPEFAAMVHELQNQPEVKELKAFLKEIGIDLDVYGERLCGFFRNVTVETNHAERSLRGFIEDVRQIIPLPKLIQTFETKMSTSPAFKDFYAKLTSEESHQLVSKVRALPVFKKIVTEITLMGIDINRILTIVYAVFGWIDDALTG